MIKIVKIIAYIIKEVLFGHHSIKYYREPHPTRKSDRRVPYPTMHPVPSGKIIDPLEED